MLVCLVLISGEHRMLMLVKEKSAVGLASLCLVSGRYSSITCCPVGVLQSPQGGKTRVCPGVTETTRHMLWP